VAAQLHEPARYVKLRARIVLLAVHGESQVLGLPIADQDGRSLGRIVTVDCSPQDPYTATWFVLRLNGLRRRWRAVPAQLAGWSVTDGTLRVRLRRQIVLTSPALSCPSLAAADSRTAVKNFYAQVAFSLP